MPHYSDGTAARLGDLVRGKPYNTPHEVIGYVLGIIPGTDSCNLRVSTSKKRTFTYDEQNPAVVNGALSKGGEYPFVVEASFDYGATSDFTLVHRDE